MGETKGYGVLTGRLGGSSRQTDDAMQALLRDKMALGYTVHGFRSSFMDWVAEVHPDRLMAAERALDHKIGNRVQRAYLRTDFLDQRRELAALWADHLRRGTDCCTLSPTNRTWPPQAHQPVKPATDLPIALREAKLERG